MNQQETPKCPHCNEDMKRWETLVHSTWSSPFQWIYFKDECPYFVRGWDWMMESQGVKAPYRHRLDPETGKSGPLPAWSYEFHKERIINDGANDKDRKK